jgi:hypothetical protein
VQIQRYRQLQQRQRITLRLGQQSPADPRRHRGKTILQQRRRRRVVERLQLIALQARAFEEALFSRPVSGHQADPAATEAARAAATSRSRVLPTPASPDISSAPPPVAARSTNEPMNASSSADQAPGRIRRVRATIIARRHQVLPSCSPQRDTTLARALSHDANGQTSATVPASPTPA